MPQESPEQLATMAPSASAVCACRARAATRGRAAAFVIVAILAAALCPVLAGCAASPTQRIARIVDDAVSAPLAELRFAGVVLVALDGVTVFHQAYGLADREGAVAHAPDTRFMVMSVSKQLTAALVMRLAAAGRLRLDDRVSRYLEHWPPEWDDVEIRHLLCHASGLHIDTTYFWLVKHYPQYWPETGDPPPYVPRHLVAAPGTTYQYANVGYTLLSMIATQAGGRPFDDLLRGEVLQPLGMAHTVLERDRRRVADRARGYRRTGDGLELSEQATIDVVGAGDVVSTAEDLARFDAAFDGDGFLPASLREAMLTPHVAGEGGASLGYGWFLRTSKRGRAVQYHSGAGAGFRAFNYRLPEERLVVIVLSNVFESEMPWVRRMVDEIAEVVRP